MFTVVLTGGIASGKSTLARYFSELGITVIDADQISRQLIHRDASLLQKIVEHFGYSVLTKDGRLDRAVLRTIVFSNTNDRYWLEQLLHPLIYEEVRHCIQKAAGPYCLVIIPLLFEERTARLLKIKPPEPYITLNRILLVLSSKKLQIQRAQERDHLNKEQAEAILASQLPYKNILDRADDIIYNQSNFENLRCSVEKLHFKYLSFSHQVANSLEATYFLRYYLAR